MLARGSRVPGCVVLAVRRTRSPCIGGVPGSCLCAARAERTLHTWFGLTLWGGCYVARLQCNWHFIVAYTVSGHWVFNCYIKFMCPHTLWLATLSRMCSLSGLSVLCLGSLICCIFASCGSTSALLLYCRDGRQPQRGVV